jgi:hypothetical protein
MRNNLELTVRRTLTSILFRLIDWQDLKRNTITTYKIKRLSLGYRNISRVSNNHEKFASVGIVLQGPIISSATLRICKRYKSLYPDATIVLSTWNNQKTSEIDQIRQLGVHIIQNIIPDNPGPANVNLQIISTLAGIKFCSQKGMTFVLKNRSDGWLSSDYFLEYLFFLFTTFAEVGSKIIVPTYNSFLFRLYSPTDQFQFGKIKSMEDYWNCPQVEDDSNNFRFPESYLLRNYLIKRGRYPTFTLADSLAVYRDYFVIAENEGLGLVLNKGTKSDVDNRWANNGFPQPMSEIHFWNWLEIQTNITKYLEYYEELASHPLS